MRMLSLVFLCAVAPCLADEVRLADGTVLVGEVSRSGDRVVVETRAGRVEVAAEDVAAIRTSGELRRELRAMAKVRGDEPFAQLQLAQAARAWGLEKEMWAHLDRAVAGLETGALNAAERATEPGVGRPDPATGAARAPAASSAVERLAQRFLASLEPELLSLEDRQAEPVRRLRELIRLARPGAGPGKCAAVAAVLASLDGVDDELRKQARRGLLDEQRVAANEALLRRGGEADRRAAFLNMVIDDDRGTRQRIAALAGRLAPTRAALEFVAPAFLHDSPPIRMHAAEVVAALGDRGLGAKLLAVVGPYAGTPRAAAANVGVRAHMAVTLESSYIRDFDVEIAQAAAVANPVVDTVTSGVVLDVKVAAVVSMRVQIEGSYRRALLDLLGEDPGPVPQTWAAFVAERGGD